jgi:hypothetical protein
MNICNKFISGSTLALALTAMPAHADVFKCVDADGHITYTNARSAGKGCKVLSQDKLSTVPGTRVPTPSPASFPKVDGDTQKARDNDRRKILDQELASEQKNLEQARKDLAEQEGIVQPQERSAGGTINGAKVQERLQTYKDKLALHERNIEALKKEIGNLK